MIRTSRFALLGVGAIVAVLVGLGATTAAMEALRPHQPAKGLAAPHFVEQALAAGLDHTYDGGYAYFEGGGVAAFDCSGDGKADLYLAGGSQPAALYRNDSPVGGDLRFAHIPDPATDLTKVTGAYPLDIDGDGVTDLAVLRFGENVLLRGLGDCRFERANERWGIDGGDAWTGAFSATWEGSNSLPTLAFGNYVGFDVSGADDDSTCSDSQLIRPDASGSRYGPPIALTPGYCTLSILFSDWDRSGRNDLRMANDRNFYVGGSEQLWRVAPGEAPRAYTLDDGWQALKIWGMGIAAQDITGDGIPEFYLTSQGDNKLQTLANGPDQPTYKDIALRRGVTAHRPFAGDDNLRSTAWHPEFQDVNNDGYMDLFVSKGNVEKMLDFAARDPSNLFIGQADGIFMEGAEEAGIVAFARGRGAALVDFNLDGLLDLVQVNRRDNLYLWRNVGSGDASGAAPMGHEIAIRLRQPGTNPDAVGAWIEVKTDDRTISRQLTIGGGHAGGQLGWIHFGLGATTHAEIRVRWPDGETGPWQTMAADGFGIVERGAGSVQPWAPPAS